MDGVVDMRQPPEVAERDYAEITPKVLRWARERSGYSVEEVARKLNVAAARVEQWEAGKAQLTMGRLEKLASVYKRPTAIFYLPEPPTEADDSLPDFRAAAGRTVSPELRYQLRRARERREVAVDLLMEAKGEITAFQFKATKTEDAAVVGDRLRENLDIGVDAQRSWKTDASGYRALGAWKDAAERAGVLVFQASRRELAGSRGLSMWAAPLPIVMLSSSDSATGRVFTLMHELAHLGLREGGICDLSDNGVEALCNQIAAAALMPEPAVRAELAAVGRRPKALEGALDGLARTFSVSLQALVLRLVELGEVTEGYYRSLRAEFERRNAGASGESAAIPQHTIAIARNGRQFTKAVLDAYHRGAITAHDASSYLNVSFKYVPDIEREIARHTWKAA